MLPHILPLIPEHKIYTEDFAGGLAVFFSKEASKIEVINDLNGEVVNFYECVKQRFNRLENLIKQTLHSRQTYLDCYVIYNHPHLFTKVRRAWAFWVLCNQGYSSKIGSWGYDKTSNSKARKLHNDKMRFTEELVVRLEKTQIESKDACFVIESRDTANTFHYVDPPYIHSSQGHYKGYGELEYERLLNTLGKVKGKFLLSSYQSELLSRFTNQFGWNTKVFNKQLSSSGKLNARKVEVLTANYEI